MRENGILDETATSFAPRMVGGSRRVCAAAAEKSQSDSWRAGSGLTPATEFVARAAYEPGAEVGGSDLFHGIRADFGRRDDEHRPALEAAQHWFRRAADR